MNGKQTKSLTCLNGGLDTRKIRTPRTRLKGKEEILKPEKTFSVNEVMYLVFMLTLLFFCLGVVLGATISEAHAEEAEFMLTDPYNPPSEDYEWSPSEIPCVDLFDSACELYQYSQSTFPNHETIGKEALTPEAQVVNNAPEVFDINNPGNIIYPTQSPVIIQIDPVGVDPSTVCPAGGCKPEEKPEELKPIISVLTGQEVPVAYGDIEAERVWYQQVTGACTLEGVDHYERSKESLIQALQILEYWKGLALYYEQQQK